MDCFALARLTGIVDKLVVYPAAMQKNLDRLGGLIHSQRVLIALTQKGVAREDAYRLVQGHAMHAWKEGLNFKELVLKDKAITSRVPRAQVERAFDLQRQLRNVDKIFTRVFKGEPAARKTRRQA